PLAVSLFQCSDWGGCPRRRHPTGARAYYPFEGSATSAIGLSRSASANRAKLRQRGVYLLHVADSASKRSSHLIGSSMLEAKTSRGSNSHHRESSSRSRTGSSNRYFFTRAGLPATIA